MNIFLKINNDYVYCQIRDTLDKEFNYTPPTTSIEPIDYARRDKEGNIILAIDDGFISPLSIQNLLSFFLENNLIIYITQNEYIQATQIEYLD